LDPGIPERKNRFGFTDAADRAGPWLVTEIHTDGRLLLIFN